MAKRKSKNNSTVAAETEPEPRSGNWLTRLLFRPRFLLFLAVAISASAAVPLVLRMLPELSEREEYRLTAADIHVTAPPAWAPRDLVHRIVESGHLPNTMSILDDKLVDNIAGAFQNHPWVAEVTRVQKSIPAAVSVELVYRKPAAMVQMKQGLYPVDADGVLLPPADFSPSDAGRFPLLENIKSPPQGPAGTTWGDVGVLGGARLAAALAPHWVAFDFAAIRAPRQKSAHTTIEEMVFEIQTRGGSRIIWGRPPGTNHPGELSADQKIGRLREYFARFGGFDQPHGPYEIDIRHWQEISRRRIAVAK